MKASRILGAFLFSSMGLLACSSTAEDTESAEGAATEGAINIKNAEVEICGKTGEGEGCSLCPEFIGTNTNDPKMENITWVHLKTKEDREACTLKDFRSDLKNRIGVLISNMSRAGMFLPTTEGQSKVRLVRISITTAKAGARGMDVQSERISGSFTAGEESGAEGSLSVFTVYMPVRLTFTFQDEAQNGVTQNFAMEGTYGMVPYFLMYSKLGINLNVGSILSKFGPGSSIGGALLTALGGKLNASFAAEKTFSFNSPRCADAINPASAGNDHYEAFDKDFLRNVLGKFCVEYAKSNEGVKCSLPGTGGPGPVAARASFFAERKLHVMEGCAPASTPMLGFNTTRWSFLAPKDWGYASGQKVYVYRRSEGRIFKREHTAKVLDVDSNKCGGRTPTAEQVCVHVLVANRWNEFYDQECGEATSLATKNTAVLAVSQDDATNTDGFIELPAN